MVVIPSDESGRVVWRSVNLDFMGCPVGGEKQTIGFRICRLTSAEIELDIWIVWWVEITRMDEMSWWIAHRDKRSERAVNCLVHTRCRNLRKKEGRFFESADTLCDIEMRCLCWRDENSREISCPGVRHWTDREGKGISGAGELFAIHDISCGRDLLRKIDGIDLDIGMFLSWLIAFMNRLLRREALELRWYIV